MENIVIEVVNVAISHQPSTKGDGYDIADVTYKNKSFQDKIEAKKIMSFVNKEVFATLKDATFGNTFTITREKNEKGFWDWINVTAGHAEGPTTPSKETVSPNKVTPVPAKSTYETAEERAERQVLIVRQSSISSAVEFGSYNKLKDAKEIIAIAKEFEAFVFGKEPVNTKPETSSFFDDMPDDIPA